VSILVGLTDRADILHNSAVHASERGGSTPPCTLRPLLHLSPGAVSQGCGGFETGLPHCWLKLLAVEGPNAENEKVVCALNVALLKGRIEIPSRERWDLGDCLRDAELKHSKENQNSFTFAHPLLP
jgi:hypothetical protein